MVQNPSCQIIAEGATLLRCQTRGQFVTALMWLAGGLMMIGAIGTLIIRMEGGLGASIWPALMPLGLGLLLLFRASRRRRELGSFQIDADARQIRRSNKGEAWRFDDVLSVGLTVDLSDGTRIDLFPSPVRWIMVRFEDGTRIRIGKGGREELQPALEWLAKAGLNVASS